MQAQRKVIMRKIAAVLLSILLLCPMLMDAYPASAALAQEPSITLDEPSRNASDATGAEAADGTGSRPLDSGLTATEPDTEPAMSEETPAPENLTGQQPGEAEGGAEEAAPTATPAAEAPTVTPTAVPTAEPTVTPSPAPKKQAKAGTRGASSRQLGKSADDNAEPAAPVLEEESDEGTSLDFKAASGGTRGLLAGASASYTLKVLSDIKDLSNYPTSSVITPITSLKSPTYELRNSKLITDENGQGFGITASAMNKLLDGVANTSNSVVFSDVGTVTYSKVAKSLQDNRYVDLVFKIESIETKTTNSDGTVRHYDSPVETVWFVSGSSQLSLWAGRCHTTASSTDTQYTGSPAQPRTHINVSVSIVYSGTVTPVAGANVCYMISDLDVECGNAAYSEAIRFNSGWGKNTYVQQGNILEISESNAKFAATDAPNTDDSDPLSMCAAVLTGDATANFDWWCSNNAGTGILPKTSVVPIPASSGSAEKHILTDSGVVDEVRKKMGETVTFQMPIRLPNTTSAIQMRHAVFVDELDGIFTFDTSNVRVMHNDKDVTSKWTIRKDGNKLYVQSYSGTAGDTNDAAIADGGEYIVTVPCTVNTVSAETLAGYEQVTHGQDKYARVPNRIRYRMVDQDGKDILRYSDWVYVDVLVQPEAQASLTKKISVNGALKDSVITKMGEDVVFDLAFTIPETAGNASMKYIGFEDVFDSIFDIRSVVMKKGNTDVTSAWDLDIGQHKLIAKSDKGGVSAIADGGTWHCVVTCTIRSLSSLDAYRAVVKNGATYAEIPNTFRHVTRDWYGNSASGTSDPVYVYVPGSKVEFAKRVQETSIQGAVPGDKIHYRFIISNTGNFTLTDLSIDDDHNVEGMEIDYSNAATSGKLAPGEKIYAGDGFTATYTITASDIAAGKVVNKATLTAKDPAGRELSVTSSVTTLLGYQSGIALTKTARPSEIPNAKAGDTVSYRFDGSNSGDVTLSNVAIADSLSGVSAIKYDWAGVASEGSLAPGEIVNAAATYRITQADIDAGKIVNTATITGTDPMGDPHVATADATVRLLQNPEIQVTKTVNRELIENAAVNDELAYTVTAKNTGNVTLTTVVFDDLLEGTQFTLSPDWPGADGVLKPGQSVTATATYAVKQADIERGSVHNAVTVAGKAPDGSAVTDSDDADTELKQAPKIKVTKTVDKTDIPAAQAGNTVTYSITGTNTGNMTLQGVTFTDLLEGSPLTVNFRWPEAEGVLSPGKSATATFTYEIKQDNIDNGSITNKATVTGKTAGGATVSDEASVRTTLGQQPAIKAEKSVDKTDIPNAHTDEALNYTIKATNTGNVTLTNVRLNDLLEGAALTVQPVWPTTTAGVLKPGQYVTATASYAIKQADIERGSVTNKVTAIGTPPSGPDVSNEATAKTTLGGTPSITLTKTVDKAAIANAAVDEVLTYTITGTNNSNVTLYEVALEDKLEGGALSFEPDWPGAPNTLTPGQKVTATVTWPLTQADIERGSVTNRVTITGKDSKGTTVTANASAVTTLGQAPALLVEKTVDKTNVPNATTNELLTYTISGTNTGNMTLFDVTLTDVLEGQQISITPKWQGPSDILTPGQKVTATFTYKVTQADIDRGNATNQITITGRTEDGKVLAGTATAVTQLGQNPKIKAEKAATPTHIPDAEEDAPISYTVKAKNTGNVTLTTVTFADLLEGAPLQLSDISWPKTEGTLAPGETAEATASYAVKTADITRGSVTNKVTVSGKTPSGAAVSDQAEARTTLGQTPAILVTKAVDKTKVDNAVAGTTLVYTVEGTNAGNMALTNVTITDLLEGTAFTLAPTWPGTAERLAAGQKVTATATYTVTQDDIDRGSIHNTVTITGTAADGRQVTGTASVDTVLSQHKGISITKTVDKTACPDAKEDDKLTYTIEGTNTGNVTLTEVALTDLLEGAAFPLSPTWPTQATGVLAPGKKVTVTAVYALGQDDIDRGSVHNEVAITGTAPNGETVTASDFADTTLGRNASISVTKTADPTDIRNAAPNMEITYTIVGKNTGATTLTGVAFRDLVENATELTVSPRWQGANGVLQPGQEVTATATYKIKQADIDRGSVRNDVAITGKTVLGDTVEDAAYATTTLGQNPAIAITKEATPKAIESAAVDAPISYQVKGTNTGNVTLSAVALADKLEGAGFPLSVRWDSANEVLQPGESVHGTAMYAVKQADIDRGSVMNKVTITGKAPNGKTVTAEAEAVTTLGKEPSIAVRKTVDKPVLENGKVNDQLTYTVVGTNTGNETLTRVALADLLEGTELVLDPQWPAGEGVLAPGASVTATAVYKVKQADIDRTSVHNEVTITGKASGGKTVAAKASADTVIRNSASLTVTKTVDKAVLRDAAPNTPLTYTVTATNSSNVTLTRITFADVVEKETALTLAPKWTGAAGALAPGESVTATGTYKLTQADIDRGSVHNDVTVTGTAPDNSQVSASAFADTTILGSPAIGVAKTADRTKIENAKPNERIAYTVAVTNLGNVTLRNVLLRDIVEHAASLTLDPAGVVALAPGATLTAYGSYTLTQADIDRGSVHNDVTATGTAPDGTTVTASAMADTALTAKPSIKVTKTATPAEIEIAEEGNVIRYSIKGTNTGNVTLTNVELADLLEGETLVLAPVWDTAEGVLAPGESVTATAAYAVKQADIGRGSVTNKVDITGKAPDGTPVAASAAADTTLGQSPSITVTKSASETSIVNAKVNDTITYTVVGTNTGNVELRNVVLVDVRDGKAMELALDWDMQAQGTLAPGGTIRGTATYKVTQDDIDRGSVHNSVTIAGTAPSGRQVTANANVDTLLGQVPRIKAEKAVDKTDIQNATTKDVLNYTVTVTNTGNLTLTGVSLRDLLEGEPLSVNVDWQGPTGILIPGRSVTGTAAYAVKQADIERGGVHNTVRATGTATNGQEVSSDAFADTVLGGIPRIAITKTVDIGNIPVATTDAVLTYEIEGANTGSRVLTDVVLEDKLEGHALAITPKWPADTGRLEPGQKVTAAVTYKVTQADIDRGSVTNKVKITGRTADNREVTASSEAETALGQKPGIEVTKTADPAHIEDAAEGAKIRYTVMATNTGNVTLSKVALEDLLEGEAFALATKWDNETGALAPGESVKGSAVYEAKQADIDRGAVDNAVTATGTAPSGKPVTDTANARTTLGRHAEILVEKAADPTSIKDAVPDTEIRYEVTITNTGNTTLTNVALSDKLDGKPLSVDVQWRGPHGVLVPGQSVKGTASYAVVQADIDRGVVTNKVTATGKSSDGTDVEGDAEASTVLSQNPAIAIRKTADTKAMTGAKPGNRIGYEIVATNTGNVTLTEVGLSDLLEGEELALDTPRWSGTAGTLAPGETVKATASYAVTQDDIDRGRVRNTAAVTGKDPEGKPHTADDSVETDIAQVPHVRIEKTAEPIAIAAAAPNAEIRYRVVATNDGNVTLHGVAVLDRLEGMAFDLDLNWPDKDAVLAPGASVEGTATYTTIQADVERGNVHNEATVTGTAPDGGTVEASDDVDTVLGRAPALQVKKAADKAVMEDAHADDAIQYEVSGTNIGNVTLNNVTVTDTLEGEALALNLKWPGKEGVLLPGEAVTGTATYRIKQADIERGRVRNTVVVTGKDPDGDTVTGNAYADTDILQHPSISLAKVADPTEIANAKKGDEITYTVEGTNTGNMALTGVVLEDFLEGQILRLEEKWPNAKGTLAPGETVRATAVYAASQEDVDRGSIHNAATISGKTSKGETVTADAEADTVLGRRPGIRIEKSADRTRIDGAAAGDVIQYTLTGVNTGNVTLANIRAADLVENSYELSIAAPWGNGEGTLAPGESFTVLAAYHVNQADVDRGSVHNDVTITAKAPDGTGIEDTDDADTELEQNPAVIITKTATPDIIREAKVNDSIAYAIEATNTGNVTLTKVQVLDELEGKPLALALTWDTTEGMLAPGDKVKGEAVWNVTQTDIDRASVCNKVTITGKAPDGSDVVNEAGTSTLLGQISGLQIEKVVDQKELKNAKPGDKLRYGITGTNTGNVTLTDVVLTDMIQTDKPLPLTPDWHGPLGILLPGQTVTAEVTYELTQEDIDLGYVHNDVIITGRTPKDEPVVDKDDADTDIQPNPGILVNKTADKAVIKAEEANVTIQYTVTATNTGNVTLTRVRLADLLEDATLILDEKWPDKNGILAPGKTVTATASHAVTQADIDRGNIHNHVDGGGTAPDGTEVTDDADVDTDIEQRPHLAVEKTVDLTEIPEAWANDTIVYTVKATNDGNVTLKDVHLDDLLEGEAFVLKEAWPSTSGILVPGESVTATAAYRLKQEDVDRGGIHNEVKGTGTAPDGGEVFGEDDADTDLGQNPSITVDKVANRKEILEAKPGDVVSYQITATNTGNVTLKDVRLVDAVRKAGEDAASAEVKALALNADWAAAAKGEGVLLPGESVTATCEYELTQADIDAGGIINRVKATGNPPKDEDPAESTDEEGTETPANPGIDVEKTADAATIENAKAGDIVTYTITCRNTGNVTLTGVAFQDTLTRKGIELPSEEAMELVLVPTWPGEEGVLAPNAVATATYEYALTQADIDAGGVTNCVTATGRPPKDDPVEDTDEATTETPPEPSIQVKKTPDKAEVRDAKPGNIVKYEIVGTNTGNVTLTGVKVTDELTKKGAAYPSADAKALPLSFDWAGASKGEGVLLPGESVKATCEYALTQADIDAGGVVNHAVITGTTPGGDPVEDPDEVPTETPESPGLDVVKTPSSVRIENAKPGMKVVYEISAKNIGNVTLSEVTFADTLARYGMASVGAMKVSLSPKWPGEDGVLRPGEAATATYAYALTQADIDAGGITNVVAVTGTTPDGTPVEGTDEPDTELPPAAKISIEKSVDAESLAGAQPGDVLKYTFRITNNGNVTLTDVSIDDELDSVTSIRYDWTGEDGVLRPGETVKAYAKYKVKAADIAAGEVENVARAVGTAPDGSKAKATDRVTTLLAAPTPTNTPTPSCAPPAQTCTPVPWTPPQTGDSSNAPLYVFLILLSGTAILAVSIRKHRKGVAK